MAQHAILRFEKHKSNPARPLEAHHERQNERTERREKTQDISPRITPPTPESTCILLCATSEKNSRSAITHTPNSQVRAAARNG